MIIGNGLIASAFSEINRLYSDVIFFASGVSNSNEKSIRAFKREEQLLRQTFSENENKSVVYFSTCAISSRGMTYSSPYVLHKRKMEFYTKRHSKFLIIRLPNLVGKTGNSANLVNFLFHKVRNREEIDVWKNSTRNILDVEDAVKITEKLLEKNISNRTLNVTSMVNYRIEEIINGISDFTGLKPKINIINKTPNRDVYPSGTVSEIIGELDMKMDKGYFKRILKKYYRRPGKIQLKERTSSGKRTEVIPDFPV